MHSGLTAVFALGFAGAVSAASSNATIAWTTQTTSTIVSFPWIGVNGGNFFVPTVGVSGSIINVESSRTTLAFTCARAGQTPDDVYNSSVGALCPWSTNTPITVTYGPDYVGQDYAYTFYNGEEFPHTTVAEDNVTAGILNGCQVTATPAPSNASPGAALATINPVCTNDVYSLPEGIPPEDAMPQIRCWAEDIVGSPLNVSQSYKYSAALSSCFSSMSATPTTKYMITGQASNIRYWYVTATEIATAITPQSTRNSNAAAISFDFGRLIAVFLALAVIITL